MPTFAEETQQRETYRQRRLAVTPCSPVYALQTSTCTGTYNHNATNRNAEGVGDVRHYVK